MGIHRKLQKLSLFIAIFTVSGAYANTELTLGGQAGALGAAEGANDTAVGYGAFVQASALDILALQLDFLNSKVNHTNVTAVTPNLVWNIVNFDEVRLGLLAGPGFYKEGSDSWRFGLDGGAFGEVSFIKNLPIGLQARYHSVFGGKDNDLWSVFMTIGYRFDLSGSSGSDW